MSVCEVNSEMSDSDQISNLFFKTVFYLHDDLVVSTYLFSVFGGKQSGQASPATGTL